MSFQWLVSASSPTRAGMGLSSPYCVKTCVGGPRSGPRVDAVADRHNGIEG